MKKTLHYSSLILRGMSSKISEIGTKKTIVCHSSTYMEKKLYLEVLSRSNSNPLFKVQIFPDATSNIEKTELIALEWKTQ